jgi:hypothetical protein
LYPDLALACEKLNIHIKILIFMLGFSHFHFGLLMVEIADIYTTAAGPITPVKSFQTAR